MIKLETLKKFEHMLGALGFTALQIVEILGCVLALTKEHQILPQ